MKRVFILIVGLLVLASMSIFAAGQQEAAAVAVTGKTVEDPGKDTFETLSEWEAYIGEKVTLQESPFMKAKVAAGEIPSLENRLPKEPVVFLPHTDVKKIGTWGDTVYMSSAGGIAGGANELACGFVMEHSYTKNIHMNIWLSMEPRDEGRVWYIKLREGLKWSDGTPYTTADVKFWYEDWVLNKEINPRLFDQMKQASGNPVIMEFLDDYTFQYVFEEPFVMMESVHMLGAWPCWFAKHYARQFHPNYTDKATLDKMVKEAGMNSWVELFNFKNNDYAGYDNPDKPFMVPWVCIQPKPATTIIFKANPFYYAVDVEGKQLPYIETLNIEMMADAEVAKLKALRGEFDFMMMFSVSLYPTAMEESKKGKIRVTRWGHTATNGGLLEFNLTTTDPILRPLFRDKRFRFGVSHAINREQIIALNYFGLVQAQQSGWSENSKFFDPDLLYAAIEYDPDLASKYLDEAGLNRRDSDGWRLRSDGKRMEVNIVTYAGDHEKDLEIIADNLKAVGLFTNWRIHGAVHTLRSANQLEVMYDAYNWGTNEGSYYQAASVGVPYGRGYWMVLWNMWYTTNGAEGEKPIPEILANLESYGRLNTSIDPDVRKAAMRDITQRGAENLWVVGTINNPGYTIIYNSKLQNVPTEFVAWRRGEFGRPTVWFLED